MNDCETINPYDGDTRPKTEQVRDMFDSIAPAYDFMNRAMTFGIDKLWRAKAVKMIKNFKTEKILDIATGTGDLAILLTKKLSPKKLFGVDLCEQMLEIGRKKVAQAGLDNIITLEQADCMNLPFDNDTFDCITVAYGVRNFEHLEQGYREMNRVIKPGGVLCVIELSTPTSPIVLPFYKAYTKWIIPAVGKMISKDVRAYSYLPESIAAVPQGENMLKLMKNAGFNNCKYTALTFGTCTIYLAVK